MTYHALMMIAWELQVGIIRAVYADNETLVAPTLRVEMSRIMIIGRSHGKTKQFILPYVHCKTIFSMHYIYHC